MAISTDPTVAVLDASVAVAIAAPEPGRDAAAQRFLDEYEAAGRTIYAPGVIVNESLYVLCKKAARGELDATNHALAVGRLERLLAGVEPPPGGDRSLVAPTARLTAGLTCNKTNDSIYLALAEQLAGRGEEVEVVTFDDNLARRADRLPGVAGRLLAP